MSDLPDDYGPEVSNMEMNLMIPLQYQFRLPLHRNSSLFFNAGMQLTVGLSNNYQWSSDIEDSDELGYGYNPDWEAYYPERIDYGLLFGGGFQFKRLQLEFRYMKGLRNHEVMYEPDPQARMSFKCNWWSVCASLLF